MPIPDAGIHRRGGSRRRLVSTWPVPRARPGAVPPISAATALSTWPAAAVPAKPASGKARNPAVHSNHVRAELRRDVRESVMLSTSSDGDVEQVVLLVARTPALGLHGGRGR